MKKVALIVLAALMSCTLLFALVACSKSDEAVIREGLATELDAYKDPTSAIWESVIASEGASLESVGLNMQELVNVWIEGLSYEIDTVTIDGDTATVEINFTCKQLTPVVSSTADTLLADETTKGLSQEELFARYAEAIMTNLKAAQPQTTAITIPCTKSDNNWSVNSGGKDLCGSALTGQAQ